MENSTNTSAKPPKNGKGPLLWNFFVSFCSFMIARLFHSVSICFFAGLILALFVGWFIFPMVLYSEHQQPLNFRHSTHMDPERVDGIDGDTELERCLYCHSFRADGTFVGNPKLEDCMVCHDDPESPYGKNPLETYFLRVYVAKKKEIPWFSYTRQPDNVYFSHIAHVKMGKLDCQTCHGDLATSSSRLPAYKKNRLTGYSINIWGKNISGYKVNIWDRMKMNDCAECHTDKGKEEDNACFVCHK